MLEKRVERFKANIMAVSLTVRKYIAVHSRSVFQKPIVRILAAISTIFIDVS